MPEETGKTAGLWFARRGGVITQADTMALLHPLHIKSKEKNNTSKKWIVARRP